MRTLIASILLCFSLLNNAPHYYGIHHSTAGWSIINKPPKGVFSQAEIAKCVIASLMGHSDRIMTASARGNYFIVSYSRPSDRQRFVCKVKFEENRAIWATIDGRWRDTPDDELITYTVKGRVLTIQQAYSDGSSNSKKFTK